MLRDMFKKTYTKIDTRYRAPEEEQTEKQEEEPGIPAGMWRKCNKVWETHLCGGCKGEFLRLPQMRRLFPRPCLEEAPDGDGSRHL